MKIMDIRLGEAFKAREPYCKEERYYMKIRCTYEGSNAARLTDGMTVQFNNLADVTKVDVCISELVEEADTEREVEE